MPAMMSAPTAGFALPSRAARLRAATVRIEGDDAPKLGGLARLVGLMRQGVTASWVPYCPDLANEVARGAGRRD